MADGKGRIKLRVNAGKWPNKIGAKDLCKSFTFKEWNERACRLANALADMGMKKGDRFAALGYNCVEWVDIYGAAAKGGFIVVPIMFRLAPGGEMEYNINHSECKVFIVHIAFKEIELYYMRYPLLRRCP